MNSAASIATRSGVLSGTLLRDYWSLVKPEVTALVLVATGIGYYLGAASGIDAAVLLHVILGTGFVAGGTAALNMYIERESDAKMRRTAKRPVPAGRIRPGAALAYGSALVLAGTLELLWFANALSSAIAFGTMASYLLLYTPLKKRTSICTWVGAFPGAAAPLIGWAAARNALGLDAWILFLILLLWQFPHFFSIAWMYRQDYSRAGLVMLPESDTDGRRTFRRIALFSVALLLATLLPSLRGTAGSAYLAGAVILGLAFLGCAMWAARERTAFRARVILHASVAYLPLLYILLFLDRT